MTTSEVGQNASPLADRLLSRLGAEGRQGLFGRLMSRMGRRLEFGSSALFFARLGLADPFSTEGAPDEDVNDAGLRFAYLSGSPWLAQRLQRRGGAARARLLSRLERGAEPEAFAHQAWADAAWRGGDVRWSAYARLVRDSLVQLVPVPETDGAVEFVEYSADGLRLVFTRPKEAEVIEEARPLAVARRRSARAPTPKRVRKQVGLKPVTERSPLVSRAVADYEAEEHARAARSQRRVSAQRAESRAPASQRAGQAASRRADVGRARRSPVRAAASASASAADGEPRPARGALGRVTGGAPGTERVARLASVAADRAAIVDLRRGGDVLRTAEGVSAGERPDRSGRASVARAAARSFSGAGTGRVALPPTAYVSAAAVADGVIALGADQTRAAVARSATARAAQRTSGQAVSTTLSEAAVLRSAAAARGVSWTDAADSPATTTRVGASRATAARRVAARRGVATDLATERVARRGADRFQGSVIPAALPKSGVEAGRTGSRALRSATRDAVRARPGLAPVAGSPTAYVGQGGATASWLSGPLGDASSRAAQRTPASVAAVVEALASGRGSAQVGAVLAEALRGPDAPAVRRAVAQAAARSGSPAAEALVVAVQRGASASELGRRVADLSAGGASGLSVEAVIGGWLGTPAARGATPMPAGLAPVADALRAGRSQAQVAELLSSALRGSDGAAVRRAVSKALPAVVRGADAAPLAAVVQRGGSASELLAAAPRSAVSAASPASVMSAWLGGPARVAGAPAPAALSPVVDAILAGRPVAEVSALLARALRSGESAAAREATVRAVTAAAPGAAGQALAQAVQRGASPTELAQRVEAVVQPEEASAASVISAWLGGPSRVAGAPAPAALRSVAAVIQAGRPTSEVAVALSRALRGAEGTAVRQAVVRAVSVSAQGPAAQALIGAVQRGAPAAELSQRISAVVQPELASSPASALSAWLGGPSRVAGAPAPAALAPVVAAIQAGRPTADVVDALSRALRGSEASAVRQAVVRAVSVSAQGPAAQALIGAVQRGASAAELTQRVEAVVGSGEVRAVVGQGVNLGAALRDAGLSGSLAARTESLLDRVSPQAGGVLARALQGAASPQRARLLAESWLEQADALGGALAASGAGRRVAAQRGQGGPSVRAWRGASASLVDLAAPHAEVEVEAAPVPRRRAAAVSRRPSASGVPHRVAGGLSRVEGRARSFAGEAPRASELRTPGEAQVAAGLAAGLRVGASEPAAQAGPRVAGVDRLVRVLGALQRGQAVSATELRGGLEVAAKLDASQLARVIGRTAPGLADAVRRSAVPKPVFDWVSERVVVSPWAEAAAVQPAGSAAKRAVSAADAVQRPESRRLLSSAAAARPLRGAEGTSDERTASALRAALRGTEVPRVDARGGRLVSADATGHVRATPLSRVELDAVLRGGATEPAEGGAVAERAAVRAGDADATGRVARRRAGAPPVAVLVAPTEPAAPEAVDAGPVRGRRRAAPMTRERLRGASVALRGAGAGALPSQSATTRLSEQVDALQAAGLDPRAAHALRRAAAPGRVVDALSRLSTATSTAAVERVLASLSDGDVTDVARVLGLDGGAGRRPVLEYRGTTAPSIPRRGRGAKLAVAADGRLVQPLSDGSASQPAAGARGRGGRRVIGGSPRMVDAFVRAESPEEMLRVILERGADAVPAQLRPVAQRIGKVVEDVRHASEQVVKKNADAVPESELTVIVPPKSAEASSSARGMRTLGRGSARAKSVESMGAGTIGKLASKLEYLIDLAEHDRAAARAQVRMAEDSAAARSEGKGGRPDSSRPHEAMAMQALRQDMFEALMREIEMREMRNPGDPEGFGGS